MSPTIGGEPRDLFDSRNQMNGALARLNQLRADAVREGLVVNAGTHSGRVIGDTVRFAMHVSARGAALGAAAAEAGAMGQVLRVIDEGPGPAARDIGVWMARAWGAGAARAVREARQRPLRMAPDAIDLAANAIKAAKVAKAAKAAQNVIKHNFSDKSLAKNQVALQFGAKWGKVQGALDKLAKVLGLAVAGYDAYNAAKAQWEKDSTNSRLSDWQRWVRAAIAGLVPILEHAGGLIGKKIGEALGGALGSIIGSAIGGPIGGFLGGHAGRFVGGIVGEVAGRALGRYGATLLRDKLLHHPKLGG